MPIDSGEDAERIAILALGHLANDPEQLSRFLALSGMAPSDLRSAAGDPAFLAGVLEHFTNHEPSLLAFAEAAGLEPQAVADARTVLSGGDHWDSI
jgi:hypothetical protein